MGGEPIYQELEQRVKELAEKTAEFNQVEKIFSESEEQFRILYEKSPLCYQSLDKNGHLLDVNQAWLNILGYTREEVIGKDFGDFLHPEWQDCFKDNFPCFLVVGEILAVEFEIVRKDGSIITVFFNGIIKRDEKGNIKQTHCILHDITERKRDFD